MKPSVAILLATKLNKTIAVPVFYYVFAMRWSCFGFATLDAQTKSAKKNQKRRQKKKESRVGHTTTEDLPMTAENMLSELKKELVIAKDKHVCLTL